MSEILNPKVVYQDESGKLYLSPYLDRLWVHIDLYQKVTHKFLRKAWDVLDTLEDDLRSRGFKCYYTAVVTKDQFNFAHNFGFNPTDELLDINGFQLDIMSKEL